MIDARQFFLTLLALPEKTARLSSLVMAATINFTMTLSWGPTSLSNISLVRIFTLGFCYLRTTDETLITKGNFCKTYLIGFELTRRLTQKLVRKCICGTLTLTNLTKSRLKKFKEEGDKSYLNTQCQPLRFRTHLLQ